MGYASPGIMDVGIVGREGGKVDIYLRGGIGEHAVKGERLLEGVDAGLVLPITIAVADFLKEENEKRGFKHIVLKYGMEKVRERVMANVHDRGGGKEAHLLDYKAVVKVKPPGGWMKAEDVESLVEIMEENYGFGVLFNLQMVDIPLRAGIGEFRIGVPFRVIPREQYTAKENVVNACIGDDYCPPALIPSGEYASRISKEFGDLPFRISFSGCTHSCGRHWIMDLGFGAVGGGGRKRLKMVLGGDDFNIGTVLGTVEPEDYIGVVKFFRDLLGDRGDISSLLEEFGVERLRNGLREAVKSFEV